MRSTHYFQISAALLGVLAGCNTSSTPHAGTHSPGTILNLTSRSAPVFVEETAAGRAPDLRLSRVEYGRLVDVYAYDNSGELVPVVSQVLVRASLVSDVNYTLETDKVTGQENLTIPVNFEDTTGVGRETFNTRLRNATSGLDVVFDAGYGQAGFYSMVPRNATLALVFADLVDANKINAQNVHVYTGTSPLAPFDARIIPDSLYGDALDFDGDGQMEFHTNRVLVDFTTNTFESFTTNPPLPVRPEGLPPAVDQNRDNVQIRIPTMINGIYGQTTLLTNLTGHWMMPLANGSVDTTAPTQDIVRAFRSGGRTDVTGDVYNGFLRDDTPPNVVAALSASIVSPPVPITGSDTEFNVPVLRFASPDCAQRPVAGDVLFQTLAQGTVWAQVVEDVSLNPDGLGTVANVHVRILSSPAVWTSNNDWIADGVNPVQFLSAYDPADDAGREYCFLETFPLSLDFPLNPAGRVANTASWGLRFSEAMDTYSFSAYDGLRLTRVDPSVTDLTARDYAVTELSSSSDRTRFSVNPHFPLNHTQGNSESFFLSVTRTGNFAPTDLAGNRLQYDFAPIEGTLAPLNPTARNGVHVNLFTAQDEEEPIADLSTDPVPFNEWGGQIIFQPLRGLIVPRPVSRFTQVVERDNLFTAAMPQAAGGVEEPLARLGTRTQFVWRMYDLDMQLFDADIANQDEQSLPWRLDINNLNLDVEKVYWSPLTGGITFDSFSQFAMYLSHCRFLPDELNSVPQDVTFFPASGLEATYANNQLSVITDPAKLVHSKEKGYVLNPGDKIQTSLPTVLMPFPLNTDETQEPEYYTWRDTSILNRGGTGGVGANIGQYSALTGVGGTGAFPWDDDPCDGTVATNFYNPGEVQSVALPLLLEFRCYPDTAATTANRLDVSKSQATTQILPAFRAISTGGINVEQEEVFIDPDNQVVATGGFNPASTPIPGQATAPLDDMVYIGGVDFVVRVSRVFSVWFPARDTIGNVIDDPEFFEPVVEPSSADQPSGTSIQFAYRGAGDITGAWAPGNVPNVDDGGFQMTAVSQFLDPYGDHYSNTEICVSTDTIPPPMPNDPFKMVNHDAFRANQPAGGLVGAGAWFDDVAAINGSQYWQVRASFLSNAKTGQSPVLSTFAMGWKE